jgi:hypothetical protein
MWRRASTCFLDITTSEVINLKKIRSLGRYGPRGYRQIKIPAAFDDIFPENLVVIEELPDRSGITIKPARLAD